MGESIFEFADILGYESPFGNWLKVEPIVSIVITKIEETRKNNADLYVVHYEITSNVELPSAKLHLKTANERTSPLALSKTISVSKSQNPNAFTISLNKSSYSSHAKNSAPANLLFYLKLEHSTLSSSGVLSKQFEMKYLGVRITGLTIKWTNTDKKTTSENDVYSFSFVVTSVNPTSNEVGVRMIQEINGVIDEFLPAKYTGDPIKENPPKIISLTGSETIGTLGVYRKVINERLKQGGHFYVQAYLDDQTSRTEKLTFDKEFNENPIVIGSCGIEYRNKIMCTRYKKVNFGPIYSGNIKMDKYSGWEELLRSGKVTESDKRIIVAMSENEGKLNAVQSYDSEIITAGAMQKTVTSSGLGEFSTQVYEFSKEHPDLYKSLFENCGWNVKSTSSGAKMDYRGIEGESLKKLIRTGFSSSNYGKPVQSVPLEPIIAACENLEFQAKQVLDFINRLPKYINLFPVGKSHRISEYIKSELGKATVLDHCVNRPAHVVEYFSQALDTLFKQSDFIKNTYLKNPNTWGDKHNDYELRLLEIYGPFREKIITLSTGTKVDRPMTDGANRYYALKKKLPVK